MTNYEKIKSMSVDEMAEYFCRGMEDIEKLADMECCSCCPARGFCYSGHNGFKTWLNREGKRKDEIDRCR